MSGRIENTGGRRMLKAVVIGCGNRGKDHVEAYGQIDEAKATACFSPDPARCHAFAAKHGLKAYVDAAEMIVGERPDIVHITTPPQPRVGLMRMVSDFGVPLCTVEKPVALGVADWRSITALQEKTKTRFAVCHQVRWQRHLRKCRQAIASGNLGEVKFIDMSAGMSIAGQGTHILNYGRFLVGDPQVETVFGNIHGWEDADPAHVGPKATEGCLVFTNGARGLWLTGDVSPRCGDPATVWQHVRVAAHAEKGCVNYEEFAKWEIVGGGMDESGDYGGMEKWRNNNIDSQAAFHRAMFDWLEKGTPPGTNLKDSLMEWAVVLALYQSALERRPITMAGFDPPDDLIERIAKKKG